MRFGSLVRDAVALAGCASVAYGVWLLSHPAAFIAGGVLAAAAAVVLAARSPA